MRLSTFTDYGLRVLMYTAGNSDLQLCTTRDISEYYDISYNHLVKVVHKLSSLGLLKVKQGRQGGFELGKDPKKINIGAVVRQLEPDFEIVECFGKAGNNCRIKSFCRTSKVLDRAKLAFLGELDKVTLYEIIEGTQKLWKD